MSRSAALALGFTWTLLAGCSGNQEKNIAGKEAASDKPTEDEVRRAVQARAGRAKDRYGQPPYRVTLLSPLYDPPAHYLETYFDKTPTLLNRSTLVACYVAIGHQANGKGSSTKDLIELHVLGQDSRRSPKDKSKVVTAMPLTSEEMVREYFGPDWLAEHPWPKDQH